MTPRQNYLKGSMYMVRAILIRRIEVIVGLQTDAPLKRGIFPKGGIRMVENSLKPTVII